MGILYKNFLGDKKVFERAKQFWKREIEKIIAAEEGFFQKMWTVQHDGNPIFSAKTKEDKAIRIIQLECKEGEESIAAWVKDTEDREGNEVHELVIAVELTSNTKKMALALIDYWLAQDATITEMNNFIKKNIP